MFYFFEPGEYIGVEKVISSSIYDCGKAIATKKDGTRVLY